MPTNNINIHDITPVVGHQVVVYYVAGMPYTDTSEIPDIGSIQLISKGELNLNKYACLSADVSKLNDIFTKSVCGEHFNVGSGSACYILDTHKVYYYHSYSDAWYEWINPDDASKLLFINAEGVDYAGVLKTVNGKPIYVYDEVITEGSN